LTFGFGNHCSATELFSFYIKFTMNATFLEIKNRIILLIITLLSAFSIVSYYKFFLLILIVISNPVLSNEILNYFIFTSITDLFLIYIILSFFIVKQITYFFFVYHTICFLSAGLYRTEYLFFKYLFFICMLLAILCWKFFNKILIPIISHFFLSFHENATQSINFYFEAKIYDYLKFFTEIYFDCFFSFQLSVFLILFANFISNNLKILKSIRKFFYLSILLLSTLMTPPDVFSQILLFLLFILGFETLIFFNILKKNLKTLTRQITKTN
jgi:sec-independent protein translocase protein TatC